MGFVQKHLLTACMAFAFAFVAAVLPAPRAEAELGQRVTNVATLTQDNGASTFVLQTNEAAFTIVARDTPSEIEFFRIVENAPAAILAELNGSDFSPSGELSGSFVPITQPVVSFSQKAVDTQAPISLVPAETYLSGELIVVRVVDLGQNGNPNRIENIVVTVEADSGDSITLRMYEDGPDTGHFYAFFPSTGASTDMFDGLFTAPQDSVLTATYLDAFDISEVSVDTALIDPFGRVFDSYTGDLLDDVSITIVDADSGLPATILGLDGSGAFPSTVSTGEDVTDTSGITYPGAPGVIFFTIMPPGSYQVVVDAPEGYVYPSVRSPVEFADLTNAPFEISPTASYGEPFTVSVSGPVNLDIPLDPNGELTVRKTAFEEQVAIGDFIGYTVELENIGDTPAPYTLRDTLPRGFRYVEGSARLDGVEINDPIIAADGRTLSFVNGAIQPGEKVYLTYLASVGPGAEQGEAVNRVLALNRFGVPLSNEAEAAVVVEDDFLTSRLTIVGRVAEAACQPDDEWSRTIMDGDGVAGVRLYMETGRYVVTDADGLFHFEGVRPGTHVVQVDEATLPPGYEPIICEENTRYAGSALSKFVDAQGGTIWRANFYLRRTEAVTKRETLEVGQTRDEDLFDGRWLDAQTDSVFDWVYPRVDQTPRGRSVNLGVKHDPAHRVQLELNGRLVPGLNYTGRDLSSNRDVAISRWGGVDIQRGANTFVATLYDADGNVVTTIERQVWFVDQVDRARLVDDQSVLVADGLTKPTIAVRLEDADGHPVHEGRIVDISVAEPYRLAREAEEEFEAPVEAGFATVSGVPVGADGIARVDLEPTLASGRVRLHVKREDGSTEDIDVWLQGEKRDWIVVGLAEAEGMGVQFDGDIDQDIENVMTDGRLAFFAKGVVKGDWLLTVAVDTSKRRGDADGEIFDEIDPNAYYTLYGDRTWQYNDAESRYPVYVKLERNTFQAVFGDYETSFTETELGRYSRRLSGLKADYESEQVSITAFATETNQVFVKDELAADGTSGPFFLRSAPLVRSSEVITVETRDRFRPDQIISSRALNRYSDYEIDYVTGELFFRLPVPATNASLNPNVIVVDYETSDAGERGVTFGARAETRFADGKLQTALTLIHEEDGATEDVDGSNLIAADVTLNVNENTELRAEVAASEGETQTGNVSGEAYLLEATHRTEQLSVTGYLREETDGFGLGQQASSTAAVRRIGAELNARSSETETAEGQDRSIREVQGRAYREVNLSQGAERNVADVVLAQDSQTFGASVGVRAVSEDFEATADPRQSVLLLAGLRKTFLEQGLTVSATWEEPVHVRGNSDDESTLFPGRSVFGIDKTLGQSATLNLRHEITNGANASGNNTIAGVTWQPRGGTEVRASTDMLTNDSGRRLGAAVGVDHTWRVSERWTMSGGLARRANISGDDDILDVAPDAAIGPLEDGVRSPLTGSEQYTSAYIGAGYQTEGIALSGRLESRDSTSGRRLVATLGGAREITKTLSFSVAGRHRKERLNEAANREQSDLRIGAAWRPRGEGLVVLNRFDLGHVSEQGLQNRSKIVNNLTVNAMVTDRTQLAVFHGIKRVKTDFAGARAKGITHLIGGEVRHDVTRKVDIGLQASWTSGEASKTAAWSFGPSIGFSPEENVWVSVGWNAQGFEDEDFEAARYTQQGPFIKLRAKFDQNSVKGLINTLGLGAN